MCDDAKLLNRVQRERVAPARILAGHATRREIVLVARAVDEHVDVICWQRATGERLDGVVESIVQDVDARREAREIEKIPIRKRQVLDLLRPNVCRDFRGAHLHGGRLDGDRLQLDGP